MPTESGNNPDQSGLWSGLSLHIIIDENRQEKLICPESVTNCTSSYNDHPLSRTNDTALYTNKRVHHRELEIFEILSGKYDKEIAQ